jgi:hypothetical protein
MLERRRQVLRLVAWNIVRKLIKDSRLLNQIWPVVDNVICYHLPPEEVNFFCQLIEQAHRLLEAPARA